LYTDTNTITTITNPQNTNRLIKIDKPQINVYNQIILKNSKGLYIFIDGTGRVYKAQNLERDKLCFDRIDSTHFYGYNAGCIFFSVKDSLYSFGGFGFWKLNGHLRYYSEIYNEWEIQKINKEVQTSNQLYYLEPIKNNLYYLQIPYLEPSTGFQFDNYIIHKLDFNRKENIEIGELENKLKVLFTKLNSSVYSFINVPALNGTMINFDGDHQYFVNYEKNEVYKLINPLIKDLFYGNSITHQVCNSFAIGNKIYYTKIGDSAFNVYSFDISMKDFVKEPYPLYESSFNNKPTTYSICGLLILLIGGSIFYVKKKRKKTQSNLEYINTLVNKDEDPMEFNPVELDLIKKMIVQTKNGSHFSVDDINSSLGINKKTLEIQKKIRTETINRINHKFKIKFNLNVDLIERIRSEEDRRFYKYIINENNGKIILS
jgi:hypothetical protein